MMLRRKKKEELDEDEELERLLRGDDERNDSDDKHEDGYLRVKIEVEGLKELTQAIEELVEALKSKGK